MSFPLYLTLLEIVIIYTSAVIQASLGIGFAMLAAAALPFFMPLVESTAIVSIAVSVMGIYLTWKIRKHINYKAAWPAVIGLIIGKALGIVILMHFSGDGLKRGLGCVLIAFVAFFILQKKGKCGQIKASPWKGLALGVLAGILGGMYNLAGPFMLIYFLAACPDKYEYSASMNFAFTPAALIGSVMHGFYGNITPLVATLSAFNTVTIVLGILTGLLIFKKINRELIEKCLYTLMIVMGFALIIGG